MDAMVWENLQTLQGGYFNVDKSQISTVRPLLQLFCVQNDSVPGFPASEVLDFNNETAG